MRDQRVIKIAYGILYIASSIKVETYEELYNIYVYLYHFKINYDDFCNAMYLINEPYPKSDLLYSDKGSCEALSFTTDRDIEDIIVRKTELYCEIDDEDFRNRKFNNNDYEKFCESMNEYDNVSEQEEQDANDNWDDDLQDQLNDESYRPDLFEDSNEEIDPMEIKRDTWGNLYTEGGRMWDRYVNKNSNEDDF